MLVSSFKHTKIIATLGPASRSPQVLNKLIKAGTNGLRLNMSHGTHEEKAATIKLARDITEEMGRPVAIIADLQGPKIRMGDLPDDGVPLVRGQTVRFGFEISYSEGLLPIQHDISGYVKKGQQIFLKDGQIAAEVKSIKQGMVEAKITLPGIVLSNQGINLPDTDLGGDILTTKDLEDIKFAIANQVDFIALSFVQTPDDVLQLRQRLNKRGSEIGIIAKIETRAAVECLEEIIDVSDGVMVARGDLAVETRPEQVPMIQKRIIDLARQRQKFVIVATQMLESMIHTSRPTRAEVSDVAGAVLERADAVMLSGETALGLFPVESVEMMQRIINYTERATLNWQSDFVLEDPKSQSAISAAAIVLAREIGAKAIIAETRTGQTARNLAVFRPPTPIIMVTHSRRVYQQLALIWGGKAHFVKNMDGAAEEVIKRMVAAGNVRQSDIIVVASGNQPHLPGGTDTVQIKVV